MASPSDSSRVTLRTLRKMVRQKQPIAFLTCYDATTAGWLYRGGVHCLLVGDTAAQMILGHDSTLPVSMDFMVAITAAVRRGAPDAFVMADMPFGSYQCGDDLAMANAVRFLTDGGADAVKLEVDASHSPLVRRMASAGIPVVAHVGSRPQQVRVRGHVHAGRTNDEARQIAQTAMTMVGAGASMLLLEAVPAEVADQVVGDVNRLPAQHDPVPVIGCGAGPACHGHVVVLHDLLGMTDWRPPFAPTLAPVGQAIQDAAAAWRKLVESGQYLAKDHPYHMQDKGR